MSTSQPLEREIPRRELESRLNLGAGEDYREGFTNVDAVASASPDFVVDLEEHPWPFPDEQFKEVLGSHILEHLADLEGALKECERILEPGGRLVSIWPMGADARADPDHEHFWSWRTPLFYCGERHWDVDVGLEVEHRECRLWSTQPRVVPYAVHSRWLRAKHRRYGDGIWCFTEPHTSGEFTVVFRKP